MGRHPHLGGADSADRGGKPLTLRLLGPPAVEWRGKAIAVPRRTTRAVLLLLARHPGAATRDQLCLLLWPDAPQSQARRNLTHTLTHLRNVLPNTRLLQTLDDCVGLDPLQTWSDVVAFEQARTAPSPGALQRAVDLYAGPFLDGFALPENAEFEAWSTRERVGLERQYLDALASLVGAYAEQRQYQEAIEAAQRYLEIDELAEDMHRRLIELYTAAGSRSAALRQYEVCAAALERELGVSPLPETHTAYQAAQQRVAVQAGRQDASASWSTLPSLMLPLVGRTEAMDLLHTGFESARAGNGRIIIVRGDAGIGKSRLLQEFAGQIRARALILVGASRPGSRQLPYHPLAEALRSNPESELWSLKVSQTWLGEASRILPELRAVNLRLPSPSLAEPAEARALLREALAQMVLAIAEPSRPPILFLDDLHWADTATLDWLAFIAARVRQLPVLVIGTCRTEETETIISLRDELARAGCRGEIELQGLDRQSVDQLLRHVPVRAEARSSLADALHASTGGNPFFMLETLRVLAETGQLDSLNAPEANLPLPDTVREAVGERVRRLTPQARQVLEAIAVVGEAGFPIVLATSGRRETEVVEALEELTRRQLILNRGDAFGFVHDTGRRVVLSQLSPMRKQLLHRRAAEALSLRPTTPPAVLAQHYEACSDSAKALHYHGLAAREAERLTAWPEAERHLSRVLDLIDSIDPLRCDDDLARRRVAALGARADIYFLQGRLPARDADLAALDAEAVRLGDGGLILTTTAQRVHYMNLDGDYRQAIRLGEATLRQATRPSNPTEHCRLLAEIGFGHYFLGEYRTSMRALRKALRLKPQDPSVRGDLLSVLSYACYLVADYGHALDYRKQALALRTSIGDLTRGKWDLTDMGIIYTRLNRLAEAEQYLQDGLALAQRIASQPAESYALNNLGNLRYLQGDYPSALALYGQALVKQRATGSRRGEASALANSGVALIALGEYTQAEGRLRSALAIQEGIGYKSGLAESRCHLARALAGENRNQEAMTLAQEGLSLATEIGDRMSEIAARLVIAWLSLRRGSPRYALQQAGEAVCLAQETGLQPGLILGLTFLGLACLALGDSSQAEAATGFAVTFLEQQRQIEGPEEAVYLARRWVLHCLHRDGEAARALRCARAEISRKARCISDPARRRRFVESWPLEQLPRL